MMQTTLDHGASRLVRPARPKSQSRIAFALLGLLLAFIAGPAAATSQPSWNDYLDWKFGGKEGGDQVRALLSGHPLDAGVADATQTHHLDVR